MWMWMNALAGPSLVGIARLPAPTVGPEEPVPVELALHNPGERPVQITTHTQPACFATTAVQITLTPAAAQRNAPPACEAKQVQIEPGSEHTVTVDLRDLFTLGPDHRVDLEWKQDQWAIQSATVEVGPLRVRAPLVEKTVAMKGSITLPKGGFTLLGHGHKSVMAGGPPSPLIVRYRWHPTGEEPKEESINLQVEETRQFQVGSYVFDVVHYEYGQSMVLKVFPEGG